MKNLKRELIILAGIIAGINSYIEIFIYSTDLSMMILSPLIASICFILFFKESKKLEVIVLTLFNFTVLVNCFQNGGYLSNSPYWLLAGLAPFVIFNYPRYKRAVAPIVLSEFLLIYLGHYFGLIGDAKGFGIEFTSFKIITVKYININMMSVVLFYILKKNEQIKEKLHSKELEETVQDKDQRRMAELGELNAGIIHEIKNPLMAMSLRNGMAEYKLESIKNKISEEEFTKIEKEYEDISKGVIFTNNGIDKVSNILSGMRKLIYSNENINKTDISFESLKEDISSILSHKARKANVELTWDIQVEKNLILMKYI